LNKQEFISLIEHPDQLGKSNITALKQLAADFPYFQAAQILLTKALYNDHHYEFEKQLKHTSLVVPDRAVLFRYIHNLSDKQQPTESILDKSEPVVEQVLENIPEPASLKEVKIEEPVVTTHSSMEIPTEEEVLENETTDLSSVNEVSQPIPVVNGELVAEEIITQAEETAENTSQPKEEPIQEVKVSESHSFTEWLQLQQGKKIVVNESPAQEEEHVEVAETTDSEQTQNKITGKTEMEAEIAEQVKRSNINDFESILDKFIRENPRISRGKAEFYNPVNMAKQSVEEDDELVTETLANVYYKQGHFKKAIRAYEKLCLIYPHKMTYFASLIQKIKTEIKE
jgi:tetratricopeptide (TPR) repeat protein